MTWDLGCFWGVLGLQEGLGELLEHLWAVMEGFGVSLWGLLDQQEVFLGYLGAFLSCGRRIWGIPGLQEILEEILGGISVLWLFFGF